MVSKSPAKMMGSHRGGLTQAPIHGFTCYKFTVGFVEKYTEMWGSGWWPPAFDTRKRSGSGPLIVSAQNFYDKAAIQHS